MSFVLKLMIAGWITTFAMIGFCALIESGKLLKFSKQLAMLLQNLAARLAGRSEKGLQADLDDAA